MVRFVAETAGGFRFRHRHQHVGRVGAQERREKTKSDEKKIQIAVQGI